MFYIMCVKLSKILPIEETEHHARMQNLLQKEYFLTKDRFIRSILVILLTAALCLPASAYADRSIATNGNSAQARVKFKVIIAPSLSMQIGTLTADNIPASDKGEKSVFVKASGNFTNKDTLSFSAKPSQTGNEGNHLTGTQTAWMTDRSTNLEQESLVKHTVSPSLTHSSNGQYLLTYSPDAAKIKTHPGELRYYVLCSP